MNHNAYFIKNNVDTEYRNIETYFTLCTTSVSEVKGLLDVGDAKNIIVEDYDDNVESHVLLPSDGNIVYKDVDVSIKLVIEGNTSYKVTEQMNKIIEYFQKSPVTFKDNYRMHGNKLILLGWQSSAIELDTNATANELMLLNLKFKKVFSSDVPFIYASSLLNQVRVLDIGTTNLLLNMSYICSYVSSNLFVEQGFYVKKHSDSTYTKYVSGTTFNTTNELDITDLTTATEYDFYAYVTTKLETITFPVGSETTL